MAAGSGNLINSKTEITYSPVRSVAGFWRRAVAFVIDVAVLCVPSLFVALIFSDFFHYHQRTATLVGLVIVIPYFSVLGSDQAGGQTLGMKVMSLEVVDREGRHLPFAQSLARCLILLIPGVTTAKLLPFGTPSWITDPVASIISALFFAIFYLAVFNTSTRQSLHDLCTGAFVTEKSTGGPVVASPFWTGHWKILAGLIVLGLISGPLVDKLLLTKSATLQGIVPTFEAVQRLPNVEQANVVAQTNWANNQTTSGVQVVVRFNKRPQDLDHSAADIAAVVLRTDPAANKGDYITIVSDEGFRVGFLTLSNRKSVKHTPAEWKQLIGEPSGSPTRM